MHVDSLNQGDRMRTRQEIEAEIAALKKELEETQELKEGDLCEFWDDDPQRSAVRRLKEIGDGRFYDETDCDWKNAKKLETKATKIPWDGGECPVDEDELVVAEIRDGGITIRRAKDLKWGCCEHRLDVIAYWRLEK